MARDVAHAALDASDLSLFAESYIEARAHFRAAARAAGFQLHAYPIAARGPGDEELTIDVALLSHPETNRALVLSSGTHGVEGFFGSAVQRALLTDQSLCARARAAASLVLIHAVNPFGFAHIRRCNEDNVDQNRNFLRAGERFEGAPAGYHRLDKLLNPRTPPGGLEAFYLRAAAAALRFGFRALKSAVAQGQYAYPQGLFFGGSQPSQSQGIVRAELAGWLGACERVLHLDLHTGMGRWGQCALCIDLPEADARVVRLKREFGTEVVQGFRSDGVLYEIRGALGPWLQERLPHVQYDCLLAEFGTHSSLSVLAAMRHENRVHHYARDDAKLREAARARMLEAFCPRAQAWRRAVLARARGVVDQAVRALARGS